MPSTAPSGTNDLSRSKRAVVVAGAGAALEFGAPSTAALTERVREEVGSDAWMQASGGRDAFRRIESTLAEYLKPDPYIGGARINFEHIFHCAQEILSETFPPTAGAINQFRPILYPFVGRWTALDEEKALRALVQFIPGVLFDALSDASARTADLAPLTAFIDFVREDHVTRIYTTNYDDFILQAAPDLCYGFDPSQSREPKAFDGESFWASTHKDCVCHLHGSVHFGFPPPTHPTDDLNALRWFDDRDEARRHSKYRGSETGKMDGTQFIPSALITGFDKLSRMQQTPQAHYYASLAQDVLTADVIYIIGCGLLDLHINARLSEARRRKCAPPLIFVDWWPGSFLCDTRWCLGPKEVEMLHGLKMLIVGDQYYDRAEAGPAGWTVAKDGSCAVWDRGFRRFLNDQHGLEQVLGYLKRTSPESLEGL